MNYPLGACLTQVWLYTIWANTLMVSRIAIIEFIIIIMIG